MYGQYNVKSASEFMMLGVGQPSSQILLDSMKFIDSDLKDCEVLQYGFKQGFESYRKLISKMYKEFTDTDVPIEEIYMTNGISQGIFMMASLLKSKGFNTVYVEDLTYFIMINVFKDLGFNIKSFNFDSLNKLKSDINDDFLNGNKSIIYVIPFCNNPTGKNVSYGRMQRMIEYMNEYNLSTQNVVIFSDETYHFLNFNKTYAVPWSDHYQDVISFGTFSKILAPGVRLGWIYSGIEIDKKPLNTYLDDTGFMDSGGSVNPLMAYYVTNGINKDFEAYKNFLDQIRSDLREKNEFLQNEFTKYKKYFEFVKPDGGYFLLIKSKKVNSDELLKLANRCDFSFHQANKFSIDKTHPNEFRLSTSYYSLDDFKKYFPSRLEKLVQFIINKADISLYGNGRLGKLIQSEIKNSNYNFSVLDRNIDETNISDIIIDVTSPEGTINLIDKLCQLKQYSKLIIGTTGHTESQIESIKLYSEYAPVMYCANFSDGIQNIIKMIKVLDFVPNEINITDIHHINKKDAPSGTAKLLKNELQKVYKDISIEIVSKREGEVVGYHEIILTNENETIKLIHNASNRNIFAKGAIRMIEKIKTLNNGFYLF
jgi:4-hydroxy-tetrahydrodipicolinate reductase